MNEITETERLAMAQMRNIDLLDYLLDARDRIESATTLAEAQAIIAEQVMRATNREQWLATYCPHPELA